VRPTRRLIWLSALWTLLGMAVAFVPVLLTAWAIAGTVLWVVAVVEAVRVWREPMLRVSRKVPHNLPVESPGNVEIELHHEGKRTYRLAVADHVPPFTSPEALPQTLTLEPGRYARFTYRLTPHRRGDTDFGPVEVRVLSPLGIWARHRRFEAHERVKVYPNFARISQYMLLATDNRLSMLGVRQRPQRGQGLEFHQLREYREGDSLARIDWKATSRHRRLISREYQDERDQQVVFLLDCGRRMRAEDFGSNHFDESQNAMLLLAYVALRQGDAVGFLSMGGITRWTPPRKGMATVNRLLNRVYDLHPTTEATDYVQAARDLLVRQRRRALVVVMTNSRDEDQADLAQALRLLREKHLVLLANLREAYFDTTLAAPVGAFDEALRYLATLDFLEKRTHAHRLLTQHRVQTLDVTAPQLPLAVVNRYLEIKRAGQL
jgi:uncharacterized protein (DUF58 family)